MNINGLLSQDLLKIIQNVIFIYGVMVKMERNLTIGKVYLKVLPGNMTKIQINIFFTYLAKSSQI